MFQLTGSQREQIIAAVPDDFFEKYQNADKSEKMSLVKSLNDYLDFLSVLPDRCKIIFDALVVNIDNNFYNMKS